MYNNQVYQEKANIHNCKCQFMRIEAIKNYCNNGMNSS